MPSPDLHYKTTPTLDTAIAMAERGFAPLWLYPYSKKPRQNGWSTAPVMTPDELVASYQPGFNLGILCGNRSQPLPGCGLVVVDIDIKDPDEFCTPYEVLYRYFDIEHLFEVQSGSGLGRHQYFACPVDDLPAKANTTLAKSPPDKRIDYHGSLVEAWQIEILSTGKQVVCPPSIHPDSRKPYRWLSPLDMELPILPASILEAVREEPKAAAIPKAASKTMPQPRRVYGSRFLTPQLVGDDFRDVPWEAILVDHGWQWVCRKGDRDHWCRPGKRGTTSATTTDSCFYPFTTSTEFKAEEGHSKFYTYAVLNFGGDMRAARKHLLSL